MKNFWKKARLQDGLVVVVFFLSFFNFIIVQTSVGRKGLEVQQTKQANRPIGVLEKCLHKSKTVDMKFRSKNYILYVQVLVHLNFLQFEMQLLKRLNMKLNFK